MAVGAAPLTPARDPVARIPLDRSAAIQWAVFGLAALLVLAPLLPIVWQSVIDKPLYDAGGRVTLANYVRLVTHPELHAVIGNTLLFAFLTTLIAVAVGAVTAIAVGRTDMPLRGVIGELLLWPLYISHLVLAFGFAIMFGPSGYVTMAATTVLGDVPWQLYTVPGMAIVAGVAQAPLTYLYCISSTTAADPSLEDAARICGAGALRTLFAVTVPMLRPGVVYSTILNFTVGLEMLAIPLIYGGPVGIETFTTFLYNNGVSASTPDYGMVGAAAVVLLGLVTLLVWLQGFLLRNAARFVTLGGKATRPRLFPLGPWRWVVFGGVGLYVGFGVLLPLLGLVLRACTSFLSPLVPIGEVLTPDNFVMVLSSESYLRSILNTLLIAVFGGAAATLLVGLIALVVHRSEFRFAWALEYLALYPRAVPGIIAGIGFFWAMILLPPLGWLNNTIWILVIAYTMRYIPTGFGAVSPMLLQIARDLDRSARSVGADWWTVCHQILLKLLRPALFSCFVVMSVHFLKEYAAAVFLIAPGSEVIGTTLLSFWIQGDAGPVAALSIIQVLLTFLFIYGARRLMGVRIYGQG